MIRDINLILGDKRIWDEGEIGEFLDPGQLRGERGAHWFNTATDSEVHAIVDHLVGRSGFKHAGSETSGFYTSLLDLGKDTRLFNLTTTKEGAWMKDGDVEKGIEAVFGMSLESLYGHHKKTPGPGTMDVYQQEMYWTKLREEVMKAQEVLREKGEKGEEERIPQTQTSPNISDDIKARNLLEKELLSKDRKISDSVMKAVGDTLNDSLNA